MARDRIILDSRGRRRDVPPPDPGFGVVPMTSDAADVSRARAAIHSVPSGVAARLLQSTVLALAFGGGIYWVSLRTLGIDGHRFGLVAGPIVGLLGAWGIWRLTDRIPSVSVVNDLLLQRRLCVVCGYSLRGVLPQADGCTVCPECGSAWRLPPTANGVEPVTH